MMSKMEVRGKIVRSTLFYLSMVLLAGVVAGIAAIILSSFINMPYKIVAFLSCAIGISTAFIVEGKLKNESLKSVVLMSVIPALIGLAIAFVFIVKG